MSDQTTSTMPPIAPAARPSPTAAPAARARDPRLDVLKAVAIALVVFGHVIRLVYGDAAKAPVALAGAFSLLALLDVPLFVFVSGYLAKPDADRRWLGKRALQLLVPYFAWTLVRWLVYYRTDPVGWLLRAAVWRNETPAVWFLYALFVVSAIYVLTRRSRALMIGAAVVCVLLPSAVAPWFSLRYVLLLFPVFVAGRLAGERRFEPGPWVVPLAVALAAVMWAGPGANLIFAEPLWARPFVGVASALTPALAAGAVIVNALRFALALSLIGSAFYLGRNAKRGAWMGALTLGVYCFHPLVMPGWARGGGLPEVAGAYAIAMVGSVGATMLLGRWPVTAFVLLGSGGPSLTLSSRGEAQPAAPGEERRAL